MLLSNTRNFLGPSANGCPSSTPGPGQHGKAWHCGCRGSCTTTAHCLVLRTGNSELVAETLEQQLGCDRERILSTKDRGIFSIVYEQFFGGADEQGKFPRDLPPYNPVIILAPIYLMKLSSSRTPKQCYP